MTDSLKERLRARKAFGLNGSTWMMLVEPDADCQEALARIEELEAEKKAIGLEGEMLLAIAHTTIAKLEGDVKSYADLYMDRVAKWGERGETIATLQGKLDRAVEGLQAIVRDVLEYERINNLSPNPGRKYCWDSIANARSILSDPSPEDQGHE